MCYNDMTAKEQDAMDNWMDDLNAEYLDDSVIEDAAMAEEERFLFFGEF